jgi:hypothetical protein
LIKGVGTTKPKTAKVDMGALEEKIRLAVGDSKPNPDVLLPVFRPHRSLARKNKRQLTTMDEVPVTMKFKPACGAEVRMASTLQVKMGSKKFTVSVDGDGKAYSGESRDANYFVFRKDNRGAYFYNIHADDAARSITMTTVFKKEGAGRETVMKPIPMEPIRMEISS